MTTLLELGVHIHESDTFLTTVYNLSKMRISQTNITRFLKTFQCSSLATTERLSKQITWYEIYNRGMVPIPTRSRKPSHHQQIVYLSLPLLVELTPDRYWFVGDTNILTEPGLIVQNQCFCWFGCIKLKYLWPLNVAKKCVRVSADYSELYMASATPYNSIQIQAFLECAFYIMSTRFD